MPTCKRCGEAYGPESKSACAAGLCPGAEITNLFWMNGVCYVNHLSWPHKKALMTWGDGKTYIAPYQSESAPRPDPDHLMRLLTSLERRLLDTECGYIELEQGLSVQEEEARKLREQVNSQSVQIEKLREQATAPALRPDTISGDAYRLLAEDCRRLERELGNTLGDLARRDLRGEAEDKAGRCCDDYAALLNDVTRALDIAEVAASDYHAAWQDAAVYWKERVASLEGALCRAEENHRRDLAFWSREALHCRRQDTDAAD